MDKELSKFKHLLEYFVAHLEYIQTGNKDSEGYRQYIEPIVEKGTFKVTGQGYKGDQIQNQISQWQDYGIGTICINAQPHFGPNYTTTKCYLNWKPTGLNIIALWNSTKTNVKELCLTEYHNENNRSYHMDSSSFSLSDLGLFEGNEPNDTIKEMYRQYSKRLISLKTYEMTEKYQTLLRENKNLILHGAPGTGKTYLAKKIATQMILDTDKDMSLADEETEKIESHIGFVQFHPSMDYTDFVEGLRPVKIEGQKEIGFERRDGIFKEFCKKAAKAAKQSKEENFVFIIDEINRGDMSKIFGELFFSIDPGYRGQKGLVKTQYQNLVEEEENEDFAKGFFVPENVYIIGTMNDIDRSVESMDFAMRRRFAFAEITAEQSQKMLTKDSFREINEKVELEEGIIATIVEKMNALNNVIYDSKDNTSAIGLAKDFQIGASYFLKYALYAKESDNSFDKLWENHLESVLKDRV